MNKKLAALSAAINVVMLCVGVWALLGGAVWIVLRYAITPQHERLASQYELLEIQPGDTVFLGDSITAGGMWNEFFPASAIRQRGIGGDTTTGVLARLDSIAKAKPKQVFLMIGTNDIFFGVAQSEIVANILEIVNRIHDASPQTNVYMQSVLPRAAKYQHRVESLNRELEKAVEGKATWINLYPLFLDKTGTSIDDALGNDELHLMGKGYLIWRDAIEHLVAKR